MNEGYTSPRMKVVAIEGERKQVDIVYKKLEKIIINNKVQLLYVENVKMHNDCAKHQTFLERISNILIEQASKFCSFF